MLHHSVDGRDVHHADFVGQVAGTADVLIERATDGLGPPALVFRRWRDELGAAGRDAIGQHDAVVPPASLTVLVI